MTSRKFRTRGRADPRLPGTDASRPEEKRRDGPGTHQSKHLGERFEPGSQTLAVRGGGAARLAPGKKADLG